MLSSLVKRDIKKKNFRSGSYQHRQVYSRISKFVYVCLYERVRNGTRFRLTTRRFRTLKCHGMTWRGFLRIYIEFRSSLMSSTSREKSILYIAKCSILKTELHGWRYANSTFYSVKTDVFAPATRKLSFTECIMQLERR